MANAHPRHRGPGRTRLLRHPRPAPAERRPGSGDGGCHAPGSPHRWKAVGPRGSRDSGPRDRGGVACARGVMGLRALRLRNRRAHPPHPQRCRGARSVAVDAAVAPRAAGGSCRHDRGAARDPPAARGDGGQRRVGGDPGQPARDAGGRAGDDPWAPRCDDGTIQHAGRGCDRPCGGSPGSVDRGGCRLQQHASACGTSLAFRSPGRPPSRSGDPAGLRRPPPAPSSLPDGDPAAGDHRWHLCRRSGAHDPDNRAAGPPRLASAGVGRGVVRCGPGRRTRHPRCRHLCRRHRCRARPRSHRRLP